MATAPALAARAATGLPARAAWAARNSRWTGTLRSLLPAAVPGSIGGGPALLGGRSAATRALHAAAGPTSGEGAAPPRPLPTRPPRIVVVGGGFGGLYTALRLDSLTGWPGGVRPAVTLLDRGERFLFKPLMYELLSGTAQPWEAAPRFSELLAPTSVRFVRAAVDRVEPAGGEGEPTGTAADHSAGGGRVYLRPPADGSADASPSESLEYDWLVLALGTTPRLDLAEGARSLALPFNSLEDIERVRARLDTLRARAGPPARVLVVGAGYTGVELASTIAEMMGRRGRVELVGPGAEIMPGSATGARAAARTALGARAVQVTLGTRVTKLEPAEEGGDASGPVRVMLTPMDGGAGAEPAPRIADLVLWTAGTVPASVGGPAVDPFPRGARGLLDTDATLRVKNHARVFALGDAAAGAGDAATAQVALQQADFAAWNIQCAARGEPLLPFRYQHLGQMSTFGAVDGAVALALPELPVISGSLGHAARKLAYLYRLPTTEHRLRVAASWAARDVAGWLGLNASGAGSR